MDDEEATDLTPSDIIRGEYAMASYRVDRLQIPARAVKAEVDAWVRQQETERGERPKRHEIREVKEMILGRLRERALVITRTYDVTWNLTSDVVQIWAGSKSVLEEVQVLMEDAFSIGLHTLDSAGIAARMGFDVEALTPTPELVKAKLTKGQVSDRVQS